MQARIKLPTHAEIEFDGDDCGIGCLYLRAESWRSDDPTCTIPAHCLLFRVDLRSRTIDDADGAEDHLLMIDRTRYHRQAERCKPCKDATNK